MSDMAAIQGEFGMMMMQVTACTTAAVVPVLLHLKVSEAVLNGLLFRHSS